MIGPSLPKMIQFGTKELSSSCPWSLPHDFDQTLSWDLNSSLVLFHRGRREERKNPVPLKIFLVKFPLPSPLSSTAGSHSNVTQEQSVASSYAAESRGPSRYCRQTCSHETNTERLECVTGTKRSGGMTASYRRSLLSDLFPFSSGYFEKVSVPTPPTTYASECLLILTLGVEPEAFDSAETSSAKCTLPHRLAVCWRRDKKWPSWNSDFTSSVIRISLRQSAGSSSACSTQRSLRYSARLNPRPVNLCQDYINTRRMQTRISCSVRASVRPEYNGSSHQTAADKGGAFRDTPAFSDAWNRFRRKPEQGDYQLLDERQDVHYSEN